MGMNNNSGAQERTSRFAYGLISLALLSGIDFSSFTVICGIYGAQERTRTFTSLRKLVPETSASTNSATWAQGTLNIPFGKGVTKEKDGSDIKMSDPSEFIFESLCAS